MVGLPRGEWDVCVRQLHRVQLQRGLVVVGVVLLGHRCRAFIAVAGAVALEGDVVAQVQHGRIEERLWHQQLRRVGLERIVLHVALVAPTQVGGASAVAGRECARLIDVCDAQAAQTELHDVFANRCVGHDAELNLGQRVVEQEFHSIVDAQVVRGVDPYLDKEALRVINSMPKWKPGMQRGKPVRVRYTVPVNFRLQ